MKKMQELLEADKGRFLQQASGKNAETVVKVGEDELNRLLSVYNDQEGDERVKETVFQMVRAVRLSLPLLQAEGESQIYSRTSMNRKESGVSKLGMILLILALMVAAAAVVLLAVSAGALLKSTNTLTAVLLIIAAMVLFFIAGRRFISGTGAEERELYAEVTVDAQKVYHTLLAAVVAVDAAVEDMHREKQVERKKDLLDRKDVIDPGYMQLMSDLLETAYADRDNPSAQESISAIRFYLHQNGIEALDYSEERKAWFDMMPSGRKHTIRPALVMDNTLIRKGLASGGN